MASQARPIKASVEKRVQDQLETDYAVRYPGDEEFDTDDHREWIEIESLGYTPLQVSGAGGKKVQSWTFQANCYARVGSRRVTDDREKFSSHRVWTIVDDVVDAFEFVDVDVVDFEADGNPTVGVLEFLKPDAEQVEQAGRDGASGDQVSVTLPAHYNDF